MLLRDHELRGSLESAPDLDIVIFGASGDLASRKVLPAAGAVVEVDAAGAVGPFAAAPPGTATVLMTFGMGR